MTQTERSKPPPLPTGLNTPYTTIPKNQIFDHYYDIIIILKIVIIIKTVFLLLLVLYIYLYIHLSIYLIIWTQFLLGSQGEPQRKKDFANRSKSSLLFQIQGSGNICYSKHSTFNKLFVFCWFLFFIVILICFSTAKYSLAYIHLYTHEERV